MTRFAVCLPAAVPLPFIQESWGPEGQIALEAARYGGLSAVEWVGGPGERGVAASRAGSQVGARHAAGSRDPELSRVLV